MTENFKPRKVVIIGAGKVGSHCALCLMFNHLVNEIVFLDINEEAAWAQCADLNDLASGIGDNFDIRVGTYADCADAHFIVMTAGRSRKPGESRLEMLDSMKGALGDIVRDIKASGFDGILISISNPSDIVVEYLYRELGLPRSQVFGTGTSLDSARMRRIVASKIGAVGKQVQAFVMGEHGDSSFIPTSHISIGGIPLREYEKIRPNVQKLNWDEITAEVRAAGGRIVAGKGSTEFGIGSMASDLITAILHDEKRVIPLAVHLDGEYGESGISAGTPCIVGEGGVEEVLELDLSYDELQAMRRSCAIIRENVAGLDS